MMFRLFLSYLLAVAMVVAAQDEIVPRLILEKSTDTNPVVENRDFVINYRVTNAGDGTANEVEVSDRYDAKSFVTVDNISEEGHVSFRIDDLAPGDSMTFNVTVQPKLYGTYDSTRARIKYSSNALEMDGVETEYRLGYSTSLGRIKIISNAEAVRNVSYFIKEWAIFTTLCSLVTLFPLYKWLLSRAE